MIGSKIWSNLNSPSKYYWGFQKQNLSSKCLMITIKTEELISLTARAFLSVSYLFGNDSNEQWFSRHPESNRIVAFGLLQSDDLYSQLSVGLTDSAKICIDILKI